MVYSERTTWNSFARDGLHAATRQENSRYRRCRLHRKHLAQRLARMASSVIVYDNLSSGSIENIRHLLSEENFRFVKGDVLDLTRLKSVVQECELMFHPAANPEVPVGIRDTGVDIEQNVVAIRNLLACIRPVTSAKRVRELVGHVEKVHVNDDVKAYTCNLVRQTRNLKELRLGGNPRALIHLYKTSKARALVEGRDYVIPEDAKHLLRPILAHRVLLLREIEIEAVTIGQILNKISDETPIRGMKTVRIAK